MVIEPNQNVKPRNYKDILKDHEFQGNMMVLEVRQNTLLWRSVHLSNEIIALKTILEQEILKLKNKNSLTQTFKDNPINFVLENFESAKEVLLTGDFVNWMDHIPMKKESGKWHSEVQFENLKYYL